MGKKIFSGTNINFRLFGFLFISILGTILVLYFIYLDFPAERDRLFRSNYDKRTVGLDISLNINQLSNYPEYVVTISDIRISPPPEYLDKKVCVSRIYVFPLYELPTANTTETEYFVRDAFFDENGIIELGDKCVDYAELGTLRIMDWKIPPISVMLENPGIEQANLFFPFDKTIYEFAVFVDLLVDGNGSEIQPATINLYLPEIQNNIPVDVVEGINRLHLGREYGYNTETLLTSVIYFESTRPFSTRLLVVIVPLVILFYMFIMVTIKDTPSAAGIALGIFIGLWSLKTVLIPDSIGRSLVIEILVTLLYMLFAWASIYRFLIRRETI